MLFDTAETLEREHGMTNKSFINNLAEIRDLSKRLYDLITEKSFAENIL